MWNTAQIPVLGRFHLYIDDVGATFPTSVDDDPLTAGWLDLGLTTEAGARFTFDRTVVQIFSSQTDDPSRIIQTRQPKKVEYDLQQWNEDTLDLATGGLTVSTVSGETRLDPKAASFVNEKALLFLAADGDNKWMLGYARTLNTKATAFGWVKTAESALPIGSEVMGVTAESPYFIQTNAPLTGS